MMGKLVTEDAGCSKSFRPQIYQSSRGRNQNRGNTHGRFRNNVYHYVRQCSLLCITATHVMSRGFVLLFFICTELT